MEEIKSESSRVKAWSLERRKTPSSLVIEFCLKFVLMVANGMDSFVRLSKTVKETSCPNTERPIEQNRGCRYFFIVLKLGIQGINTT